MGQPNPEDGLDIDIVCNIAILHGKLMAKLNKYSYRAINIEIITVNM